MKEFLYLFRGGDAGDMDPIQSPEQWEKHMIQWKKWMVSLAEQGKLTGGQPLNKEGKVLTGSGKKITDGPFVEGKEIVGGYLLVKANDLKEATELAKGCPIFDNNGIVEVREIQEFQM
jgi:hypothetical protein